MNLQPLVSVIIIFLNGETYLQAAIESVFSQTYENWELLLVDDGSTDSSTVIAKKYAAQYPEKIRYLEHPNHANCGMSASRNLGIENAIGDYVAFLDADDIWLPQKLERQLAMFATNPEAKVVFGPTQYWYSWTGNPEDSQRDCWREIGISPNRIYYPPKLLSRLLRNEINAPATCSVLIRRELFKEIGGFEADFRGLFEDRVFFSKVYLQAPVYVSSECWDKYRQHPNSTCHVAQQTTSYNAFGQSEAHRKFLSWLRDYLTSQNVTDTEVWQTLEEAFFPYHHRIMFWITKTKYQFKLKLIELLNVVLPLRLRLWLGDNLRMLRLKRKVKHLHGLSTINYGKDELIVLSVVRNGELYIKSFIEHYFALGVKHIVFLDNGSTDDTIAIASSYDNVTILQAKCQYQSYENVFKKYLVNRFSQNRWNLFVDIDELFDYPYSDVISLKSLLTYLNQHQYTAVVAQMLDLFADKPLHKLTSKPDDSLKEIYQYYDISDIRKENYFYGTASNTDVKLHWGGIRKKLFGTENGLTKAALTFIDNRIKLFVNFHHVKNARIADFTGVLYHYPFLSTFYEKVVDAVKTDRYKLSASSEYQKYWQRLKQEPDINLKTETAKQLTDVNDLLDNGFLVASANYMQFVKEHQPQKNFMIIKK